jgi:hypothetical protein
MDTKSFRYKYRLYRAFSCIPRCPKILDSMCFWYKDKEANFEEQIKLMDEI